MQNEERFDQLVCLINDLTNEKTRRLLLGCAAQLYGPGGTAQISRLTGMSANTIRRGMKEADSKTPVDTSRIRAPGAGRKSIVSQNPAVLHAIRAIIESEPGSTPDSTTLSLRKIQTLLQEQYQISISHIKVGELLDDMGISRLHTTARRTEA